MSEPTNIDEIVTAKQSDEEDAFDKAFAEPEDKPKDPTLAAPPDKVKDKSPTPDPEKKSAPTPDPKEPAPAKDPDPTPEEIDWKVKYEKELHRNKSWEGRINAANQKAKEAQERLALIEEEARALREADGDPPEDLKETQPKPSDQEIAQFEKDFPDIAPPVQKLIKTTVEKATGKIAEKQDKAEKDEYTRLVELHYNTIREAHADVDEIMATTHVADWIESQPAHLQRGLQDVIDKGTALEIISLLDAFKKDAEGYKQNPKGEAPDPNPTPDKKTDLEKLVAVNPSPAEPKTAAAESNKDDFDSAWDEAPEKEFSYT